jgi:hypothetical protein
MNHRREVVVRLTVRQVLRVEELDRKLWPEEDLMPSEVTRRLLLEHLLWSEEGTCQESCVVQWSCGGLKARLAWCWQGHRRGERHLFLRCAGG